MIGTQELATQMISLSGRDVPLNSLINFSINRDDLVIPDEVRELVLNKVSNAWTKIKGNTLDTFPWDKLRAGIDWKWMTNRGKLPKRIRSFMHKEFEFSVSDNIIEQVGDICLKELPTTQEYFFDVSDNLHWRSGDFGDHQSCFLNSDGSPSSSVEMMEENGHFLALRFFRPFGDYDPDITNITHPNVSYIKDSKLYLGVSRAWLFQKELAGPYPLLFNSYGYNIATSADILSRYLEVPKKWVDIHGTCLHINSCGGYVLGSDYKEGDFSMAFWPENDWKDNDEDFW